MKTKIISISIEEIINLKSNNENLNSQVDKLNIANQDKILQVNSLKRENEDLKLKYQNLEIVNRFNLGKCEAYETVIKHLIGGQ